MNHFLLLGEQWRLLRYCFEHESWYVYSSEMLEISLTDLTDSSLVQVMKNKIKAILRIVSGALQYQMDMCQVTRKYATNATSSY